MKPITLKTHPHPKRFYNTLVGKLNVHSREAYRSFNHREFALAAKDARGRLVGGLSGRSYWGWLFVSLLWVDKTYRGRGLGKQLLEKAETLAQKRGCRYVHLDTFSFQAPDFYKKLGYKRFGLLKPYPMGVTRSFLYKKLVKKN